MSFLSSLRKFKLRPAVTTACLTFFTSPALDAAVGDLFEYATAGTAVTFGATADGSPTPKFQWMKDGAFISGATNATFVIPIAGTAHSGVYNVLATNAAGWDLSNDLILSVTIGTVTGSGSSSGTSSGGWYTNTNVAPSFTLQPFPSASAPAGSSLTLSAQAVGSPTPTYQWRKNGIPIEGATNTIFTLPYLTGNDSAIYTVSASNVAGTATSNNSIISVFTQITTPPPPPPPAPTPDSSGTTTTEPTPPPPEPVAPTPEPTVTSSPRFSTWPVSQSVPLQGTATFTVAASNSPTYQWYKDGVAISGATDATYTITGVTYAHVGEYKVVAKNSAGWATSNRVQLTVLTSQ
jgi:hypothetical protein